MGVENPKLLWSTLLTDYKSTDTDNAQGKLRWDSDGNAYRFVYNNAATTIDVGSVCNHAYTDGEDAMKKVITPSTATLGFMAGIAMTTVPSAKYFWIQVFGINSVCKVRQVETTAKTAGDYLKGVNAAVYADADTQAGGTYARQLQLMEAIAAAASAGAVTTVSKRCRIYCL